MKTAILFLSITIASGLLLTNLYTSLVDAKSWGSDVPNSLATARQYFKTVNPGLFFRIFSPLNQALALLSFVLFRKSGPSTRLCLGLTLAFYLLAEAMTFGYFYPRNNIMFGTGALSDVPMLKKTFSEWRNMNWVRTAVLLAGIVSAWVAVYRIRLR